MREIHSTINKYIRVRSGRPLSDAVAVRTRALLVTLLLGGFAYPAIGQECSEIVYEHKNQIDPSPIELGRIQGTGVDREGIPIPQMCVGIFTDQSHKLLRFTRADENGTFSLATDGLPDGEYRLVVQALEFCPANQIVRIRPNSHKKRRVQVHMEVGAVDTCSYVVLAKR